MAMTARYTVDGMSVEAIRLNRGFPGVYVVRSEDGRVLGHVRRTVLGDSEVYLGATLPDAVDAQMLATHRTMRYAVEHLVRAVSASEDPTANPEVLA